MFGTKVLYGLGIQHSVPAIILRDGLSGAAFSAGSMGARYALDETYRPSTEEAAKDAAVGFFFGAVTSLLKSSDMTCEAKARMSETVEQIKRDYGTILADSGGKVTLDALSGLSAKSAQVRGILGNTQFVGQQATVKGVLQFLDALDDAVAGARANMGASMQGLVPGGGGAAPGLSSGLPVPGEAGTRDMPMLPGPVEDRDDWEVAIEEAVEERNRAATGRLERPEDVDISGKYDIIGTGMRGQEILWERDLRGGSDDLPNYKEINIHGVVNSELDEVDLTGQVIYEDKNANRLYMENPNRPQTEKQWADTQIYTKTVNRILALQQETFRMSSGKSSAMPSTEDLKAIRTYIFRIDADTLELREAVWAAMERLSKTFPGYEFYAVFGGK